MKRKIVSIFCVLCILSLFVESIYALDYKTVFIKDLNTNNLVSNAYITILNIESGKSYNYITDDTGNINIPINEYNELNGPILYISSHNNEYYGSYSMNMSNKTLYVEEDSSFRNGNLAPSAVDSWETLKKEHMNQYKNIEYSRDAFADLFKNENMYINSVINYAMSKIDLLHDKNIRAYTIVVGQNVDYDLSLIHQFLPQKTKLKISIVEIKA